MINLIKCEDILAQKNFDTINAFLDLNAKLLAGSFQFHEIVLFSSVTDYDYNHNMKFRVRDVILTGVYGGTVTFNYDRFTDTTIRFTASLTTSPMKIRLFLGNYGGLGI